MSKGRILVIEDEPDMLENCQRILEKAGYEVVTEQDSEHARDYIPDISPDVILTDLIMPKVDGMTIIDAAIAQDPDRPVILFTAYASVDSAVEAIRKGAFDYVPKPFTSGQLVVAVDRAFHQLNLLRDNRRLNMLVEDTRALDNLVGSSKHLSDLHALILKVAEGDASVLITGESGTGKELVAKALHLNSRRRNGSFVPVDCVALPETLLEGELFGHEKGAFTGAHTNKPGLLEIAHKGTLFLDEVSKMTAQSQAKLLRVLQEKEFRRLGSNRLIKTDFRILAATNDDLEKLISSNKFREDLYYRLNVIHIHVPPLRERADDIPLLAAHFLKKYRQEAPGVKGIARQAMERLVSMPWPGNVRQLENAIRRAMALADGSYLKLKDFKGVLGLRVLTGDSGPRAEISNKPFKKSRDELLNRFEKEYLLALIKRHKGNISVAAEEAGIDRRTIHRMLKKHGIVARALKN